MFYLHLRNELWKLFGKKRTYIGFGTFLIAHSVITAMFRFSKASQNIARTLNGNGYDSTQYITALTVASVMLFPIAYVLLPLFASLIGGDLVAKEAEDGTLRMILSRPISRFRLLLTKWAAGAVFSLVLALSLGIFGLVFAKMWFPWKGGMVAFIPGELFSIFEVNTGLQHYAVAHVMLAINACTIMGLAFMFSCFNVKPAAATILALAIYFINFVLMNIPFFQDLKPWFFNYHLNLWELVFMERVPWWRVNESLCILLAYNVSFLAIGCSVFHARDIKS